MASATTLLLRQAGVVAAAAAVATFTPSPHVESEESKSGSKLLFLGTGSSTGCPKPLCTMLFHGSDKSQHVPQDIRAHWAPRCKVSSLAIQGDPKNNKNYRNNPSLLISRVVEGRQKNIVIDTGKTFRETSLRWMPMHGISSLDGIVLTHQHMDAAAGLDDVRGFQNVVWLDKKDKSSSSIPYRRVPTPVHLSQFTLNELTNQFHWLFPKPSLPPPPSGTPVVHRDVAAFDVHVFRDFVPFEVASLQMIPLPVWHGDDLICHGFAFEIDGINVVYLSDISRMIPETLEYIQTKLPPTDIMVVDALLVNKVNPVHYSLEQALELIRQVQPKQAYLVGMNCDSFLPHDEANQELSKLEDIHVQLAHDGMVLDL